jgi:hypothetical protein
MDDTAFDSCGNQLSSFLVKQFNPPPGAACALGFLGQGIAVDPDSFLSGGEFNPARVNLWLSNVVEPLAAVGKDDNRIDPVSFTAFSLMESIAAAALSLDPVGSDAQLSFAKVKSQAMENLGGATVVNAAPLDWYDPKHLPDWPKCTLTVSSTASTGSGSSTTPMPPGPGMIPPRAPLWAWRSIAKPPSPDPALLAGVHSATAPSVVAPHIMPISVIARNDFAVSHASVTPVASVGTATLATAEAAKIRIAEDNLRTASLSEKVSSTAFRVQAIGMSEAIAKLGNQASTSSVDANSLTLSLSYRMVQLSREPWWNDLLLLLSNWYIPSLQRGNLIAQSAANNLIGVPIELILTANVQIEANWSATDRSSASNSTHVGPWALQSSQFSAVSNSGRSTLSIPGMQAVACIYRGLPVLPPNSPPA